MKNYDACSEDIYSPETDPKKSMLMQKQGQVTVSKVCDSELHRPRLSLSFWLFVYPL